MAINYNEKAANELVQKASLKSSVLHGVLNDNFDFVGVKTVKVMTVTTQPMNDYTREGANRYGTPAELQDTVQELTLNQDKSFAVTIDKGNLKDQGNLKKAEDVIELQIQEQALPLYDTYCLGKLAAGAGGSKTAALTKSNIIDAITDGTAALDDAEFSDEGRTLLISAKAFKVLKISDEFTKLEPLGTKAIGKGVVGQIDGMKVVKVPSSRMPAGVGFIIVHRSAATAPKKLADTKIHQDPPGISGNLLEGRWYYDCFVLEARNKGVYVHKES